MPLTAMASRNSQAPPIEPVQHPTRVYNNQRCDTPLPGAARKDDPAIYPYQQQRPICNAGMRKHELNSDDLETGQHKDLKVRMSSRYFRRCFAGLSWKSAVGCFLLGAAIVFVFGVVPVVAQRRAGDCD